MRGGHLQLILAQGDCQRRAIAWRWISEAQIPERIDLAFRINMNHWQGEDRLQMEVVALRAYCPEINLHRKDKTYRCLIDKEGEMVLVNPKGEVLKAILSSNGKLKCTDSRARNPYIHNLIEEGLIGLGLRP